MSSDEDDRRRAAGDLANYTEAFERTGASLDAWKAIHCWLVARDTPLPRPIGDYLLSVAVALTTSREIPPEGAVDTFVAKAVGVRSHKGKNPFREQHRYLHEIEMAINVLFCHEDHRDWAWDAIFEESAKRHGASCAFKLCKTPPSVGTVKRYWYKHYRDVIPRHLVAAAKSQTPDGILR